MKSLLNEQDRKDMLDRLASLSAESTPAWGRFTAGKMVCHVVDCLRMAHGNLATRPPARCLFTVFHRRSRRIVERARS
jgi:hypothetical protein